MSQYVTLCHNIQKPKPSNNTTRPGLTWFNLPNIQNLQVLKTLHNSTCYCRPSLKITTNNKDMHNWVLKGAFWVLKGAFCVLKGAFWALKGAFWVLKGAFSINVQQLV